MSGRSRHLDAGLIIACPIRAESVARLAYLQLTILEIKGHLLAFEEVEARYPSAPSSDRDRVGTIKCRLVIDPNVVVRIETVCVRTARTTPFRPDLFAAAKTQLVGDFAGQNGSVPVTTNQEAGSLNLFRRVVRPQEWICSTPARAVMPRDHRGQGR